MEQQAPSIYDENDTPLPQVIAKATFKQEKFGPLPVLPRRKEWSTPLVFREKLMETLNLLEKDNYEIFTILTVSASHVQIVCFQEVDVDERR